MNEGSVNILDEVFKDRHLHPAADIARTKIAQRVLGSTAINLLNARVWDAVGTILPGAGASDDLGLISGVFATAPPTIETGDLKAAGSTTRRCRFLVSIPPDYEDSQTVVLRLAAGMKTTIADVAATVDVEAYLLDDAGSIGSDICATAAMTINSLTAANKDFTITPTSLVPGSVLDVRVSVLVNDAATATAVIGRINNAWLLADMR